MSVCIPAGGSVKRRPAPYARATAVCLLLALLAGQAMAEDLFDPATREFARQLDLSAFQRLGIFDGGRVKLFDTFAREELSVMTGQPALDGQGPTFSYLELYFNAGQYFDKPLVRVRESSLREHLANCVPATREMLERTGRLPPGMILGSRAWGGSAALRGSPPEEVDPGTNALPRLLERLRTEQEFALAADRLMNRAAVFLAPAGLKMVPSPVDDEDWLAIEALKEARQAEQAAVFKAMIGLAQSWRDRDAAAVNARLAEAVRSLHQVNPDGQPSPARASAELLYNRLYRFTLVWVGYLVSFVLLLGAVVRRTRRLRRAGLFAMGISTAALAAGFLIRWWLSGRPWYLPPVTGQFESVTGAALLGAVFALVLECIWRRNYFALGASFFASAMLLCGWLLPQAMNADISPAQGILNNWILPLHVGVIILGYAFVAMGLVISVAYLGTLCLDRGSGTHASPLAELDHSNLIVAQLAFWMISLGTMLGAYWADYSWGRWWGFDAKETWALITMLVYVAVIHGRLAVSARRRGLWTALLTVLGAAGVFFNWVIVKYLLPSLHGYA